MCFCIVTEILNVLIEVIGFLLEKKLSEKDFFGAYGKVCVAIDEMIQQVILRHGKFMHILISSPILPAGRSRIHGCGHNFEDKQTEAVEELKHFWFRLLVL